MKMLLAIALLGFGAMTHASEPEIIDIDLGSVTQCRNGAPSGDPLDPCPERVGVWLDANLERLVRFQKTDSLFLLTDADGQEIRVDLTSCDAAAWEDGCRFREFGHDTYWKFSWAEGTVSERDYRALDVLIDKDYSKVRVAQGRSFVTYAVEM